MTPTLSPFLAVRAHFVEAGHILGSAAVVLDLTENGRTHRLWFSGDIGRADKPLLRDPVLPGGKSVDTLLMECTYGDRPHDNIENAVTEIKEVVNRTVGRGGKVIIPSFSVGRTQTLVYYLNELMANGEIPKVPVLWIAPWRSPPPISTAVIRNAMTARPGLSSPNTVTQRWTLTSSPIPTRWTNPKR